MYTITKGPSKLATQRRTGPTQQVDNQINEFKHKQTSWTLPAHPSPKIVFNRPNGKKYHRAAPCTPLRSPLGEEGFTAAHQDNVQLAHDAWQEVLQQLGEEGPGPVPDGVQGPVFYKESGKPAPHMDDFVPIDLDEWWAQRFLANIDKPS
ncbi:hypothetical protein CRUP_011930 [Coryphaenoides rupestris]|nr:hypothetical protein CRUP_011930 [Coryphaenoides rupestris]